MLGTDRGPTGKAGAGRWLGVATLGLSGLLVATGGLLHPHVPGEPTAQMDVLSSNARWLHSHWTLTLGQPLALVGVLLLARRLDAALASHSLWGGALLVSTGLLVGTLGTLSAATGLPAAAETGREDLYGTVNAFTLGLGWTCLVLASAGGALLGGSIARLREDRASRVLGWTLVGATVPLLVAMAFLLPSHPWTHDIVLRASAVAAGALLLATGGWLAGLDRDDRAR